MMREGGLPATDRFNRVRLRVNDATKGAQVPWNASKLEAPFYFFVAKRRIRRRRKFSRTDFIDPIEAHP